MSTTGVACAKALGGTCSNTDTQELQESGCVQSRARNIGCQEVRSEENL